MKKLIFSIFVFSSMQVAFAMDRVPQEKLNKQLISAVNISNVEQVQDFLGAGADANTEVKIYRGGLPPQYHTALTLAATKGNEAICTLLINAGADIAACSRLLPHGHPIFIAGLRDKGLTIPPGLNALDCAASFGHESICRLLFKAGADVNAQDAHGNTALMWAAWDGQEEICKLLLAHGAELNLESNNGMTALGRAAEACNESICRLLIESGAADQEEQLTKVLLASVKHEVISRLLIEKGARVNVSDRDCNGNTVLMTAASNGHESLCHFFIDRGADVNAKDNTGRTALRWAIDSQNAPTCQLLISKGADVNTVDDVGNTPLMVAAGISRGGLGERSKALCDLLINAGADIQVKNGIGWNALMWAARDGCAPVCKLLVAQHQKADQGIKTTLLCMNRMKAAGNQGARILYRHFKALLLPHLNFMPLSRVLTTCFSDGKKPYDYLPIDCLNPDLLNRSVPQESIPIEYPYDAPKPSDWVRGESESSSSSWCSIQ